MGQLHTGHGPFRLKKRRNRCKSFNLRILPQSQIPMGAPPVAGHCGCFGIAQPRATTGKAPQMHHVPGIGMAIVGAILTHRRHSDAIAKRDVAQLEGRK